MVISKKSLKEGLSTLIIDNLFIKVNLGVSSQEKKKPQNIALFIKISFNKIPSLAYTDNIKDGVCYEMIVKEVQKFCVSKKFNVIEHLALEILSFLNDWIIASKIQIKVQKWPKIKGLKGSVMFECETN